MTPLHQEILKHIKVPPARLKNDEELHEILKRRLTKKELKCLQALSQNEEIQNIRQRLNLSSERYDALYQNLVKKLNQEKLKQELASLPSNF